MVKRECRISVEGGLHARAGLKRERERERALIIPNARVCARVVPFTVIYVPRDGDSRLGEMSVNGRDLYILDAGDWAPMGNGWRWACIFRYGGR